MMKDKIRCAVYTRKSTEEGLEKEFNTLEAQRESCENFIKSRSYEGWELIPKEYNDGGYSGGNMKRPALQELLNDIKNGQVDMIVVYKIDRLTRSLIDFSKLIEILDLHSCSFVSVTQQFNTADCTGRLMLNVLLSFAQFEREISSERIRDKIAASKKKGMWMGGSVPLGYDVKEKKLIINEQEAEIVRFIFNEYKKCRSEMQVTETTNAHKYRMKDRKTKNGEIIRGGAFSHSAISAILRNPIYMGYISFKGELYEGQHQPIISRNFWDDIQIIKCANRRDRFGVSSRKPVLLRGLIECGCCGTAMIATASKKKNKYYEYYTSSKAVKEGYNKCTLGSIPAGELDAFVVSKIKSIFKSPEILQELTRQVREQGYSYGEREIWNKMQSIDQVFEYFSPGTIQELIKQLINKIVVYRDFVIIRFNAFGISLLDDDIKDTKNGYNKEYMEFKYPISFNKKHGRTLILTDEPIMRHIDTGMLNMVCNGFRWHNRMMKEQISIKELARKEHIDRSYMCRVMRVVNLAPDIIKSIMNGTQPRQLKIENFVREEIPYLWSEQRQKYGFKSTPTI